MNSPPLETQLLTSMGAIPTEFGTTLFFGDVRLDLAAHGHEYGIRWTARVGTNAWQEVRVVADCLLLVHQHGRQQGSGEMGLAASPARRGELCASESDAPTLDRSGPRGLRH